MFYIIKFFVNLLIFILKYIMIGFVFLSFASLCLGIVIPITIIYSTFKFMWKFNTTALIEGCDYIIFLYQELCDIYLLNIPKFKTWK